MYKLLSDVHVSLSTGNVGLHVHVMRPVDRWPKCIRAGETHPASGDRLIEYVVGP